MLSLTASVDTPFGAFFGNVLETKEYSPLEPGVVDHKLFVRGIGTVREQTVRGGSEWAVLVSVRHA